MWGLLGILRYALPPLSIGTDNADVVRDWKRCPLCCCNLVEEAADLFPLDYSETHSVAFADFNNDGWLDIVLGNHDEPKQLLTFSQCPNGGATLHGSSWCFPCPHFMGRPQDSSGYEFSVCRECSPYFSHDAGPTSLSLINPLVSSVPPGRMVLRKAVHQRSVILVHLALVVFPVA